MTSKADLKSKLEFTFDLYDIDKSGSLDFNEVNEIMKCMLDLLGARGQINTNDFAKDCFNQLDSDKNGKINKGIIDFIINLVVKILFL